MADATMAPPPEVVKPGTEEAGAQRRWYHYDGSMVTFEEFQEKPMGVDVAKHHATDATEPTNMTVEEAQREKFMKLMSEDEVRVRGDAWALQEMADTEKPWEFLTGAEKAETLIVGFIKFCSIWGVLYLFIIALGIMGNAFKLLGGRSSGRAFRESELITNPVAALAIGVLATVLMQSSSTTTSIVISMAASDLVTIEDACYLVMGANIGTSVTNTIVSIAHLNSPEEYRRAFTGAVFHDMFNWLTVGMFLPLEVASGFLLELAKEAVASMGISDDDEKRKKVEFIKKITKPASGRVVSVDKKLIEKIAQAKTSAEVKKLEDKTMIKQSSGHVMRDIPISDSEAGVLLLFVSLTMLAVCLLMLVKLLQSVLQGRVAVWTRYLLNLDFKHPCLRACGGVDSYILLLFGTGCTILVQSSSVFTSTLTPLVGIGLIHVEKMTALTHGANIGTTVTGVLSALSGSNVKKGMTVALEHVFFNSLGTVVWFVVWPLRPVPLGMAKFMGETAGNLAWFPLCYIILAFFLSPLLIIGLAFAGWGALAGVMLPIAITALCMLIWIYLRRNRADLLPTGCLRSAEAPCGCRYPNFMQLWGGDAQEDAVDIAAMQEAEEADRKLKGSVRPWASSPMAWGLCILAFIGAVLALPTAQWRRVQYRTESRGRKEVGVGLYKMCSAAYEKDHSFMDEPEACDLNLVAKCAAELSATCASDALWANTSSATGHEAAHYKAAWAECSKRGCRAYDWSQVCPEIPACQGANHPFHAKRCQEPLDSYYWYNHRRAEERQCVAFTWEQPQEPVQARVVEHNSQFYSSAYDGDEGLEAVAFDMQARATNEWRTGEQLVGLGMDTCAGVLTTVSAASPGVCPGGRMWNFELKTRVPSKDGKKVRTMDLMLGDSNTRSAPVDVALGCTEQFADAQVLDRAAGTFIGGVEGASVATIKVWNKQGQVLATYIPKRAAGTILPAGTHDVLPAVFAQAGAGRGLAALAVSPNKETVLACLSAPMGSGNSPAVRCAMVDVSEGMNAPKAGAQKVVLLSDVVAYAGRGGVAQRDLRLAGASFIGGNKVLLLEKAVFGAGEPAGNPTAAFAIEADFGTGDDLNEAGFEVYNGDRASALVLESRVATATGAVRNAMVALASNSTGRPAVRAVATRKVMDLADVSGVPSSNLGAVLVGNAHTLVFASADAAPAAVGAAYVPIFMVQTEMELSAYDRESCPGPVLRKFKGGDSCRDIEEICPVGDLAGDMESVAGLAITGTLFLGIGMVVTVLYALFPWNPALRMGHFISAGTLTLAWVLLLTAWAHLDQLTTRTYGCYFEDESTRGGLMLHTGELECLTRHSYSWGFCLYAWGLLTLALGAVWHRVVVEVMYPWDPEAEAANAAPHQSEAA